MNRHDAEALLGRLLRQVAPEVELDGLDRGALLQDEADLDSMDFLNIVTALSEETGIEVPERDYPELATVTGFVDYIVAKCPDRRSPVRPRSATRARCTAWLASTSRATSAKSARSIAAAHRSRRSAADSRHERARDGAAPELDVSLVVHPRIVRNGGSGSRVEGHNDRS